jgi:uncharacterized membrane protein
MVGRYSDQRRRLSHGFILMVKTIAVMARHRNAVAMRLRARLLKLIIARLRTKVFRMIAEGTFRSKTEYLSSRIYPARDERWLERLDY